MNYADECSYFDTVPWTPWLAVVGLMALVMVVVLWRER